MKIQFLLLFIIFCHYGKVCMGARLLPNSTFQDLLVHIKDDVPEGNGDLLRLIKEYMRTMSQSLWTATTALNPSKPGVQIGNVIIRIPRSWRQRADEPNRFRCNEASLFITSPRENNYRRLPFTKQTGQCGSPGQFTRYPHTFFGPSNPVKVAQNGKIMMNEFVKWRYGVFSEKPYRNVLTVFDGERYLQSSCGADIRWTLSGSPQECSVPGNNCTYSIDRQQSNQYSVMFDTEARESAYFCNDGNRPHNRLAMSLQNLKCDGQSISRVILNNADFSRPRIRSGLSPVRFTITKGQKRKIVLVIDVSISMINILDNVKQAVTEFITNKVEETASVGVVSFHFYATINAHLLPMSEKLNKDNLTLVINRLTPTGWTNIGDGLVKAVEVLGSNMNSTDKVSGTVILLTDGYNNRDIHLYNTRIENVIRKGILVNTISYGTTTDPQLNRLAIANGGRFLFANTSGTYSDLMDKLAVKEDCDNEFESSAKILEVELTIAIDGGRGQRNLTYVDSYVGKDLVVMVVVSVDVSQYACSLVDPYNFTHTYTTLIRQVGGTTLTFKMPGKVMEGQYTLDVKSNSSSPTYEPQRIVKIVVTVSATADINASRTINPTGQLSASQIDRVNSRTKVLVTVDMSTCGISTDERVTVSLRVTYPSNRIFSVRVLDDGVGSDSIAKDDIFSAALFSRQLSEVGFYTLQASVTISSIGRNAIHRTVSFESLRVIATSRGPLHDVTPPARIEDVKVVVIDSRRKILRLDFLATGDDELIGNISTYDIALTTRERPVEFKTVDLPAPPRQPVSVQLNLVTVTGSTSFELSVRGVDRRNNAGQWSRGVRHRWSNKVISRTVGRKGRGNKYRIVVRINF